MRKMVSPSTDFTISPLPLSPSVESELCALASSTDILVLGETHGTKEVPRLALGLIDRLTSQGYAILALEIPKSQEAHLLRWARLEESAPPPFFAAPSEDGRGNVQVLSLVREAVKRNWAICAFDVDEAANTNERDLGMSQNLTRELASASFGSKVLAISGNLHSRLTPPPAEFQAQWPWPSFASSTADMNPELRINTVAVVFHGGEFYNFGIRSNSASAIQNSYFSSENTQGHTASLHLPSSSAATFYGRH